MAFSKEVEDETKESTASRLEVKYRGRDKNKGVVAAALKSEAKRAMYLTCLRSRWMEGVEVI